MKKIKASSFTKLIAFLLIATILICLVGFSAEGWQSRDDNDSNSDKAVNDSGNVDEDKDQVSTPQIPQIKYYDYLTGKEVSETEAHMRKVAFLFTADAPLYGISKGDLVMEFPTADNTTRLLVYTDAINSLGKIGTIAPTKGFISNMIGAFGGILVASGTDENKEYESLDVSKSFFDLSKVNGYSYTEYTHYVYSNCDLIKAGLTNNGFSITEATHTALPYIISTNENFTLSGKQAEKLVYTYGEGQTTELYYSLELGKYVLYKNGVQKNDLLYDKAVTYDNAFVLFANSLTYESESGSDLILETLSGGTGYYARDGVVTEIFWEWHDGVMRFSDSSGKIITVGQGNSYIGFMKSSQKSLFSFN